MSTPTAQFQIRTCPATPHSFPLAPQIFLQITIPTVWEDKQVILINYRPQVFHPINAVQPAADNQLTAIRERRLPITEITHLAEVLHQESSQRHNLTVINHQNTFVFLIHASATFLS